MKLTDYQIEVLKLLKSNAEHGGIMPYAMQCGTCKALTRRGLAELQPGGNYTITMEGTVWLKEKSLA